MTCLTAVIGDPVHHSLSPTIVNAAFEQLDLDWKMLSLQVPEDLLDDALLIMKEINMGGMSVTMPHKKSVAQKVEVLEADAKALDAVNCIVPNNGKLVGHNTDGAGFLWSLAKEGVALDGAKALIFGAGGASRAVGRACILAGAEQVGICARSKAEAAAELLGEKVIAIEKPNFTDFQVLINATPLGMAHLQAESPIAGDDITNSHIVVDLIYSPAQTKLLELAKEKHAKAIGGLGMLIGQAVSAVKLWTGKEPDPENMQNAAMAQSNL